MALPRGSVNRSLKIVNDSGKCVLLGKNHDTSVIKIRPVVDISEQELAMKVPIIKTEDSSNLIEFNKAENSKTYVNRINSKYHQMKPLPENLLIPEPPSPEECLKDLYIEEGVMNEEQGKNLQEILTKYHKVFDNDISEGYNNASGEFDVDWNWLNDQKPPPGVSKQEVYSNEEMNQIKQDKIDWMESQNICFKAHLLGAPVKYASLTMLVGKSSLKNHEGPLNHGLFRFVNLFNQLNEYIALEPSQPEAIDSVLYDAGQWNFMISGDLTNSFYQRWIAKRKLPFMAFHSPYKGMYILARSAQGMKNQSEGLDQMMRVVLGDLIKQGKARKIADDVQAGGNTVDEAIANFALVLKEFDKNNIKMAPKKTRIFAKKLPIFGWIKEGQMLKPDEHRILAIEKSEKPKTITQLRSYLGQYRVFFKNMRHMSAVLEPLEKITGEKNGKMEITWTEELDKAYNDSKLALKNIGPLYLPKRSDRLAMTLDWSKSGMGATMFALLKDRKVVVAYFSATLSGNQSRWPPCDGEGLIACIAIDRFSHYIREATQPTLVCSDSKPVVQAVFLLMKGIFSSSQRLNRLLSNCNTFPLDFHHLSGKLSLNDESDTLSRNPSECKEKNCPVCVMIADKAETLEEFPTACRNKSKESIKHVKVEDTLINQEMCSPDCNTCGFILTTKPNFSKTMKENFQAATSEHINKLEVQDILDGSKPFPFIGNRKLLIQVQKKDPVLSKLYDDLQSGHRPNIRNTKSNDLKTYLGFKPKIDHDGLIVIDRIIQPYLHKITIPIIPPSFAKSVMLAAHIKLKHPKTTQFEKLIFRNFCTLKIKNLVEELSKNCYLCQADLNLPKDIPDFKTETKPEHPGSHWCCDILKHGGKNIMVSTDNFSSFTICKIIPSEKQDDCENAIISSIFPFKAAAGVATIRVDTAPGLTAMINHSRKAFSEAEIEIEPGDVKNKNSCAKVDKTMAELRSILRSESPEGSPLSEMNLQKATETLNMKIRNMNLSAREIMFSRMQTNNENIILDDKLLSDTQFNNRKKANIAATKTKHVVAVPDAEDEDVQLHSLVFLKHDVAKDKSKVRDLYIVMDLEPESKISIQKVLHPFTDHKSEINNRHKYRVKKKDVYLAPSQQHTEKPKVLEQEEVIEPVVKKAEHQELPVNSTRKSIKFYVLSNEEEVDDDEEINDTEIYVLSNEEEVDDVEETNDTEMNEEAAPTVTSPELQPKKPARTYHRLRLNTFPQVSQTNLRSDYHQYSPRSVFKRWQLSQRGNPGNHVIDILPSTSSSIVEPLPGVEEDFGVLDTSQLSWDHTIDVHTPSYDETDDDLARVAKQVALHALDEFDEVFEDAQLFDDIPVQPEAHNQAMMQDINQLNLSGEFVQPGRVYRLDNRLAVTTDKLLIKQKRLVGSACSSNDKLINSKQRSSSLGAKLDKKDKKKKKSKIRWFVKKLVFAKKPPNNDDPPDPIRT